MAGNCDPLHDVALALAAVMQTAGAAPSVTAVRCCASPPIWL